MSFISHACKDRWHLDCDEFNGFVDLVCNCDCHNTKALVAAEEPAKKQSLNYGQTLDAITKRLCDTRLIIAQNGWYKVSYFIVHFNPETEVETQLHFCQVDKEPKKFSPYRLYREIRIKFLEECN